jgi:hypothetical protein
MTKRERNEYEQRRALQDAGWRVDRQDKVCFNGGSETNRHYTAKNQVAYVLSCQGYRIDSEVQNQAGTAEADIVSYGNGEPPFVVEVETGLTEEVKEQKLEQFYHNTPFCEVYLMEVNELPEDRAEQLDWVLDTLGGEI